MRIELQRLHREIDATVIYVTHDQTEAMTLGHRIAVLNKGKLMQVDTPLRLYNAPANTFVAGFIGSPSMNFLRGSLRFDKHFYFSAEENNFDIPLGLKIPDVLKDYVGKDLIAGIRPEHVLLSDKSNKAAHLVSTVNAFENTGSEQLIYLSMRNHLLIARRSSSDTQSIGETIAVNFAIDKISFFDNLSGERIVDSHEFI